MTALALVRQEPRMGDDRISFLLDKVASGAKTKGAQEALRGLRMRIEEMAQAAREGERASQLLKDSAGGEDLLDRIREQEEARAEGLARGEVFRRRERDEERREKFVQALRSIAKATGVSDEKPPPGQMRYVGSDTWCRPRHRPETRSELDRFADELRSEEPERVISELVEDVEKLSRECDELEQANKEAEEELESWRTQPDAASELAEMVFKAIGAETFEEDVDLYNIRRAAEDVLETWGSLNRIAKGDAESKREHERIQERLAELRRESQG